MLLRKLLWRRAYNEKVDIWSASAVLYVMSGGAPPFYGETAEENLRTVLRGDFKRNFSAFIVYLGSGFCPENAAFINLYQGMTARKQKTISGSLQKFNALCFLQKYN
ncbi:hypothetical protein V6N11_027572 [Hibiscus sabdariffa]|uniref:Protein kinase domain-containing protein n=1 Tax=Hibiscus sabdariffa TaxID=183260 RepID=A0ABR1Z850_9ROSI